MSDLLWFVAHTRPRCEKKLAQFCAREQMEATLPCYRAVHKYAGKIISFDKPLFPGYVFLRLRQNQRQQTYQSDYVANLLDVHDQALFIAQLGNIVCALDTGLEIQLAPEIGVGKRVRIVRGPLRSIEGWVEERYGMSTVLLRLDFISQAAAVKVEADDLELA
jgi:transcriptional antiterminator RfaH